MKEMKILLIVILLFACYESEKARIRKKRKPHIIIIYGDDVGYNDVGWNNERIYTPYMNKLAKEGVILDNYYTHPLCTPSRAALMSGYYADRLGLQRGVLADTQPYGIPLKFTLLPHKMNNLGYTTVGVGKWHIGFCSWSYIPVMRGFQSFLGFFTGAEENYRHCANYFRPNLTDGSCVGFDFTDGEKLAYQYTGQFSAEIYNERIIDVISKYKKNDPPLFAYVSLTQSHWPLQAPSRYSENCKNSVNGARENMCAAMASMDENVRNITEALKKAGMYENSVIIFASDNGGSVRFGGNNYPLRGDKGTLYDGACHVPAFVHSKLLKKTGYRNTKLIHVTDWYPTILNLVGGGKDLDSSLDGYNQWGVIEKNGRSVRKSLPYNLDSTDDGILLAAVRDERYKLIAGPGGKNKLVPESDTIDDSFNYGYLINYTTGQDPVFDTVSDREYKVYDLKKDRSESNNIAKKHPEILKRLMKLMQSYRRNSRPAVNIQRDESGDAANHNNSFVPGWCVPYFDTPTYAAEETNQNNILLL